MPKAMQERNPCSLGGWYKIQIDSILENSSSTRPNVFLELFSFWRSTIKCSGKVSMTIFLDILWWLNQCTRPVKCWKHWDFTICPRSMNESTSNPRQCLKSFEISKETFYIFRRIKLENYWKWIQFQTALFLLLWKHLPVAWSLHKTQCTSLSFRISHTYLATQTTFSGILESLLHSSQLQCLLFTISQ